MSVSKKLAEWEREGLITAETSQAISEYERRSKRPFLLYALTGLGALSIILGFISLIASNWESISPSIKISIDLLIGFGLGGSLALKRASLERWVVELLMALITGWTLASIALVGQIYQLGGDGRSGLTVWAFLVTPLLLQGRSVLNGALLLCVIALPSAMWINHLSSSHALAPLPALTLAALALSLSTRLYQLRPELMSALGYTAALITLIAASIAPLSFYGRGWSGQEREIMFEALMLALPALYGLWSQLRSRPKSVQHALFASFACAFTPLIPHEDRQSLLAILCFVVYWYSVARAALDLDRLLLFRVATFLIAARLIIVYFELVGSLFDTGVFFVVGGLVVLFGVRLWYRTQERLVQERTGR
jgi:uncharacterized membrane protein